MVLLFAIVGVPLFLPRVGVVIVAVTLPETKAVFVEELNAAQPLGALPKVLLGYQRAQRVAVLRGKLLPVVLISQQRIVLKHQVERHVGGVALLTVKEHVLRRRLERRNMLKKLFELDAFP